MKETQSDFVFQFRRNSSRYSLSSSDKKCAESPLLCNVQLKRASWSSSFPHLQGLSSPEEEENLDPPKMEVKTSTKSRSSENLKKPHKLIKSKSTSFFKTTSSFRSFFSSAFSSQSSSSAASVASTASSGSSCSSSSVTSSPKVRSSWSSGVTHILERDPTCGGANNPDDYFEVGDAAPAFITNASTHAQRLSSNGIHTRNGSLHHVTSSLLEEEEEDHETIMNTPKILCAHKKTPDVERKTRVQIARELEVLRHLQGSLPPDEGMSRGGTTRPSTEDENVNFYENLSCLSQLKGYKPKELFVKNNNLRKAEEESLNEINLRKQGFLFPKTSLKENHNQKIYLKENHNKKISLNENLIYSYKNKNPLERSKSLNNNVSPKEVNQRTYISHPQDGVSANKIDNRFHNSYQETITYNPLVNDVVSEEIDDSDLGIIKCSERNVILDMLNYSGVNDLIDDDSDCDSSDVITNIDDESSCFEKRLEDNLEKLCDNNSREISTVSIYELKESFLVENNNDISFQEKPLNNRPYGDKLNDDKLKQEIYLPENSSQEIPKKEKSLENSVKFDLKETTDGISVVGSNCKIDTVPCNEISSEEGGDAVIEKVQLRKKNKPNLHLDIKRTQVTNVLQNEKLLRRITGNEVEFGAKSPKTPKSPAIDIDECFNERQKKLKDSPKDNLTKVKDLTQRLRLPLEQPSYIQWLNGIPNKESAQQLAEVISPPVVLIQIEGEFRLQENSAQPTEAQRSKNITNALLWIKEELVKMKQQDQHLASQLVHLQLEMQRLRLVRSCTLHEALLEEVTCEEEEQKAYMTSSDLYDPPNSHRDCATSVLRDIGVTRMNIASRRFTLR